MDLSVEVRKIASELIALRRDLHMHPELGKQETWTSKHIREILVGLGLDVRTVADTGLCAELKGALPGRTVALRADMDALPITEPESKPFHSLNPGVMHACGHDIHTASLVGAAMLLSAQKDKIRGTVRFLFQPDEEGDGGAERMIADGCMDGVDAVFGMHVAPELPCGVIGVRPGSFYAASNPFDLTVRGRSSHGAEPQLGHDAIVCASAIVSAVQTLVSRETSALDSAVITIGSFHAGTARNILADEAKLKGIIRCFGPEMRGMISDRLTAMVNGIAAAMNCECDLHITWGYSGIINDATSTSFVKVCLTELFGAEQVIDESVPTLTTEDFGAFLTRAPGCYWHMGVGKNANAAPLHNPDFDPDERSIPLAAAAHAAIVLKYLNNQEQTGR